MSNGPLDGARDASNSYKKTRLYNLRSRALQYGHWFKCVTLAVHLAA